MRKRHEIAALGKRPSKGPDSPRSWQIMAKLRRNLLCKGFAVLPQTVTRAYVYVRIALLFHHLRLTFLFSLLIVESARDYAVA